MVKRNQGWERRVELTDLRRTEAKQRRQRTADKRQHKVYAQDLLSMIDRHAQRPFSLHIWTDCVASDSVPLLDVARLDQMEKSRARSGSMNEHDESAKGSNLLTGLRTTPKSNRKGRARSNSVNDSYKSSHDEEVPPPMQLCRSHFFTGKCQDLKSKKGGCRYSHYVAPYKTLWDVLQSKRSTGNSAEEVLKVAAEQAASDADQSMDMVHYIYISAISGEDDLFISEEIAKQLNVHEIKPAGIVYAAINDELVFDRNQEGLLMDDREFLTLLNEKGKAGVRRLSIDDQELLGETLLNLPGSILEHALLFLPDAAVAIVTQVCKTWHQEIGRSPNLWKQMLERHGWPLPCSHPPGPARPDRVIDHGRDVFRELFINHYTAARDMKAMQSGFRALESRKGQAEKEMCYQDFSTRKNAPLVIPSNYCVGVHVWSPNHIIAGYSHDSSLRLFECIARDGNERLCRELICLSVDPYKNTKRRDCTLVSLDVDRDFIGCLCQIRADRVHTEAWILVVLGRDEFLEGESGTVMESISTTSDESRVKVIDVGEAVLNFLLSSDVVDHRLLQVIDFLGAGGEVGEVEILVSHSLAACGDGRFMVEASVSIPAPPDEDIEPHLMLVDRKLVLFSANAGAIVWIGDSNDMSRVMRPRDENLTLSHARRCVPGGSRHFCHVAVSSPVSSWLLQGSIEPTGHVQSAQTVASSNIARQEMLLADWHYVLPRDRAVLVTASSVVAADAYNRLVNERISEYKTVISVFPLHHEADDKQSTLLRTIELDGNLEVMRLTNLRDHYVIAICRVWQLRNGEEVPVVHPAPQDQQEDDITPVSLVAVCLHLATGCEIGRFTLLDQATNQIVPTDVAVISAVHGSTIGVAYGTKGIIMTGDDVRSVGSRRVTLVEDIHQQQRSAQKKKKKKVIAKNNKKDGFMRGMSLRG